MTLAATPQVFPNPVFEGSEKRIEVDFRTSSASPTSGLRSLSRAQLDELMSLAACTIVSPRKHAFFDAYVLSESSLFVYPTKFVLKTCGTTKLLDCVPRLLEMAAGIGMEPRRCKFSRATLLFPKQQAYPHQTFDDETVVLRGLFGHLGNGGSAHVLGDRFNGLQWFVYVADADGASAAPARRPTFNFEVCMTELDPATAQQFFRSEGFVSAAQVTDDSGIRLLCPDADVDDYVFEPCGYSMNGVDGKGFITIHITPEDGFSYASVELSGFADDAYNVDELVDRVLRVFKPGQAAVALTSDVPFCGGGGAWGTLAERPKGYGLQGATFQELCAGGRVAFYSLSALSPPAPPAAARKRPESPASPETVLMHMPSFASSGLGAWDSDGDNTSTDCEQADNDGDGGRAGGASAKQQQQHAAKKMRLGAAAVAGTSGGGQDSTGQESGQECPSC